MFTSPRSEVLPTGIRALSPGPSQRHLSSSLHLHDCRPRIPMSIFVLDSQCGAITGHVTARTSRTSIAIDRLVDHSTHIVEDRLEERVLGHCFMYDPGLMWAMCHYRVDYAPGCHPLILRQSDRRITTRYSSPIQLGRCTEETQALRKIPTLECKCICP
jgi:hypothetical protein